MNQIVENEREDKRKELTWKSIVVGVMDAHAGDESCDKPSSKVFSMQMELHKFL